MSKSYQNDDYGFWFSYPDSWTLAESNIASAFLVSVNSKDKNGFFLASIEDEDPNLLSYSETEIVDNFMSTFRVNNPGAEYKNLKKNESLFSGMYFLGHSADLLLQTGDYKLGIGFMNANGYLYTIAIICDDNNSATCESILESYDIADFLENIGYTSKK